MHIRHACGHSVEHEISECGQYSTMLIAALEARDCQTCATERVCAVCRRAFPITDDQPHLLAIDLRYNQVSIIGAYGQQYNICSECGRTSVDTMTHLFNLYTAMPDEVRLLTHKLLIERMRYGEGAFRSRMSQWGSDGLPLPTPEPLISGILGARRVLT